jgi:hypothetical protein
MTRINSPDGWRYLPTRVVAGILAFVWYHGLQKIGWSELLLPEIHTGSVVERTDSRPIYVAAEGRQSTSRADCRFAAEAIYRGDQLLPAEARGSL